MIALEALARRISDSEIAPTVERITFTLAPSTSIFSNELLTASAVPFTSALTMIFKSTTSPDFIWENKSSRLIAEVEFLSSSIFFWARSSPTCLASFSVSNTMNLSPASGTSFKPVISTGVAGPAALISRPRSSTNCLTRP